MRGCLPRASEHWSFRTTRVQNIISRFFGHHPLCVTAACASGSAVPRSRSTQAAAHACCAVSMDGAAGAAASSGGPHHHNGGARHKKHKHEGGYQGKLLSLKLTPAEATAASRARTLHLCGWDVEGVSVAGEVRRAGALCLQQQQQTHWQQVEPAAAIPTISIGSIAGITSHTSHRTCAGPLT